LAPYLEKCLGNDAEMTIVNKPGAGGELGFAELARAVPDGYTLGALNVPNMPLGAITKKATYSIDSFDFLGNIFGSSVTINVARDSEFKTLQDVVDTAKKSDQPIQIGLSAIGSDDHLIALRFIKLAGIKATFIPFGDGASARNALLGGHVKVNAMGVGEAAGFQEQLRTLANSTKERSPGLLEAPTFAEQGYDLIGGANHVIGAPKGLPDDVREKLAACLVKISQDKDFITEADKRVLIRNPMNARETTDWVKKEAATLKALWESDPWM
jgi:tripartite-type tricarboxylate transporter receptor subunit TctC